LLKSVDELDNAEARLDEIGRENYEDIHQRNQALEDLQVNL